MTRPSPPSCLRRYYCSFGANLEPQENATTAIGWLCREFGRVTLSGIIETEPESIRSQLNFLNFAFWFDSELSPEQVKARFNQQEMRQGRDRDDPLCSSKDRPLDLDILSVDLAPELSCQPDYLVPLLRQLLCGATLPHPTVTLNLEGLELGNGSTTVYRDAGSSHIRIVDQHP